MQKNLHPYRFWGNNELLSKRQVYGTVLPSSELGPEIEPDRIKALRDMDVADLRGLLANDTTRIREKKAAVENLIPKIDSSGDDAEKADLRKEVLKTLAELESSPLDIMESVRLRFQLANLDSTPYDEIFKIVWPSKEATRKLFSNITAKTIQYMTMAVILMGKLKAKVTNMWENVSQGRPPTGTSQTPPNAPGQPAPATPESREALSTLPESILALGNITIPEGAGKKESDGFITFSSRNGSTEIIRYVKFDGSAIKLENNEDVIDERNSLFLPKYLKDHSEQLTSIFGKLEISDDMQKKINVVKTLIKDQEIENNKRPHVDLINLLSEKWEQFTQTYQNLQPSEILTNILTPSTKEQDNGIIQDFKKLPTPPSS